MLVNVVDTTAGANSGSRHAGGWQPTTYLSWSEVKDANWLAYEFGFNVSIDIMPDAGDDQARKRLIQKWTAHLGEAIKRRTGETPIGFTVFEKGGPKGRDLHGHFMLYVEPEHFDIVRRLADGKIIEAKYLGSVEARTKKASYVTKQRRPQSPEFELHCLHRYEQGPAPVPGKRISFTKRARAMLANRDTSQSRLPSFGTKRKGAA